MARRGQDERTDQWLRQRALATALLVIGALVFTWPFVRTPPLDLARSYLHLLVVWGVLVVALFVISRVLADEGGDEGADRDA